MRTHPSAAIVVAIALSSVMTVGLGAERHGQARAASPAASAMTAPAGGASVAMAIPTDYVIGADDVLTVSFWGEGAMSSEVLVRPDGKVTLPLINDIAAAGLTPDQFRQRVTAQAGKFVDLPNVTVVVKTINSRQVFITGQVEKPGSYVLRAPTTVLQLIAMAGGLKEYADASHILIVRTVDGQPTSLLFDYKSVTRRKNLGQNVELKPGDTIVVP